MVYHDSYNAESGVNNNCIEYYLYYNHDRSMKNLGNNTNNVNCFNKINNNNINNVTRSNCNHNNIAIIQNYYACWCHLHSDHVDGVYGNANFANTDVAAADNVNRKNTDDAVGHVGCNWDGGDISYDDDV